MKKCLVVLVAGALAAGALAAGPLRDFPITSFGAKPDGAKCTEAFRQAISAAAQGGGRVVVPAGEWVTGAIHLRSNVTLHLEDGAKVVFTDDVNDYLPPVRTSFSCIECYGLSPLLYASGCTNVAVTGGGTFAPRMDLWRTWFDRNTPGMFAAMGTLYGWGESDEPVEKRRVTDIPGARFRPCCIEFDRCRNVTLDGFRVRESPCWTVHLRLCEDVTVRGLDLAACGHNNDGIDIDASKRVLVEGCRLLQGDDGFVIKSGRDRDGRRVGVAVEDVEIRDCTLSAGHALLSVGSEVAGGVRNVCIHDCRVEGAVPRLIYVKTSDRKGAFVENVVASNLTAQCVREAVVTLATGVDYQWGKYPARERLVTRIEGIRVENVMCETAGRFYDCVGDARLPARNVAIRNVTVGELTGGEGTVSNVTGFVKENLRVVPDPAMQTKRGFPSFGVPPIFPYVNQDHRAVYTDKVAAWPRLKGVQMPTERCTDETFRQLKAWGVGVVRCQAGPFRMTDSNDVHAIARDYLAWVPERMKRFEAALALAKKHDLKLVLLMTIPGGRYGKNVPGRHERDCRIFWEPVLQDAVLKAWTQIVNRLHYRLPDISTALYGYDLFNEPDQFTAAPCDYWTFQRRLAEAIRAIDAETPILVEAGITDNPWGFEFLSPLKLPNVIYQVHMYAPHGFTHQIQQQDDYRAYPNAEKGWDKAFLRAKLQPVVDFQRRHGCRIFVGEFSAIGWAPGADRYLADCIDLFREYGWDWTYHAFREWPGWSVEHEGRNRATMRPAADTARKRVLLSGFRD